MRLEAFLEKFDLFADTPDAVAKMRGLILRLAMLGKLAEPQATDGPVSQLLREVEEDRARLGLGSSAKVTSGNSEFSAHAAADEVPATWTLVSFGNIARHNAGKTLDKGRNRGQLRDYITTSNLYWGYFQLDAVRQMPILDDELERCTAIKGDLLICEGGEAGRAAVWPHEREISFQNHVHRARFFAGINPYFVQRYFEKLNATGEIDKYRKGVGISNMSGKALASIPIPLPPLAEQKRIVAKVDELMALCDRLEAQQQEREAQHAALARASLARFVEAPTPANLDFLFHKSYSIPPADLRKSILTLAVQGHLSDGANPGEWPSVTMREACLQITDGEHATPQRTSSGVPLATAKNVRDGFLDLTNTDYVAQSTADKCWKRCKPRDQDILMVCVGATTGRVCLAVNPPDMVLVRSVALLRPNVELIAPRYLDLFLRSPAGQSQVWGNVKQSAQPCLYLSKMANFVLSLPPVVEQLRIVAKVDELMTLVDALEAQLATAHKFGSRLLDAVVAELTQGRALA